MDNINVSIMNIRTQKHCLAKAKKSALHSVGNRAEIGNPIDALAENNRLWVLGEEMQNGDEAKKIVHDYMDNLKPKADYHDNDVLDRTHQKKKIRKWLTGAKTGEDEKEVFQNVMDNLENGLDIDDSLISDFEKIDSKISRRNDKIKSLKSLQKSHNKINNSDKKGSQLDVLTVEKVFKITHKTDFEMTSKDQKDMQLDFHQKHFPEFPIIYLAEHNDEMKAHCHFMHSGKNSKTGEFDYPDAEVKVVQKFMQENNIECTTIGKKWSKFDEYELKQHGEVWQEMNYQHANKKLLSLGITDKQFKQLEGDDKKNAHDEFSNNPMAKKDITTREHNNAGLNKIKNEELTKKNNELDEKAALAAAGLIASHEELKEVKEELKKTTSMLDEAKETYQEFKKDFKSLIKSGKRHLDNFFKGLSILPSAKKVAHDADLIEKKYDAPALADNVVDDLTEKTGNDIIEKIRKGEDVKEIFKCPKCKEQQVIKKDAVCIKCQITGVVQEDDWIDNTAKNKNRAPKPAPKPEV